ncbi:MAG: hypothetical protein QNJ70_21165 [Xenococcaceae cyanobacterium MO_207.B15]|nr:hypothetical protein [Xenococcaceae cyanobacterium MO_207.B15]
MSLSSDIPIGLGFGDTPTTIELNLNSENVESFGDNLTLVGGDINISNTKLSSETITLGSLADSGILNIEGSNLIFPEDVAKGDINITVGSQLIVTDDGGSFEIDAGNFTLDETSEIIGGVDMDTNIQVDDSLLLDNNSSLPANGGDIEIFADNITVTNSSNIDSLENSAAGSITINTDNLTLESESDIQIVESGLVTLDTSDLTTDENIVTQIFPEEDGNSDGNGATISAGTTGTGNAGTITIDASPSSGSGGNITFNPGESRISTSIYRLQNTDVPGAYIYVGTEERDSILDNFSNFIDQGVAFQASITSGDDLNAVYRFQNVETSGSYLFAGESERQDINNANLADSYIEEGLAFYVYGSGSVK